MASPSSTRLGRDIAQHIPAAETVDALVQLPPADDAVWRLAAPHLAVRNNDSHTLYAYGIARALLRSIPAAHAAVVRPAILLHDTGWSTVPEEEILEAIAPGGGRPDLVRRHEIEGVVVRGEHVHPHRSGVHAPGDAERGMLIAAEHDPAETVRGVVRDVDRTVHV